MSIQLPLSFSEYEKFKPTYVALAQEVEFIIREAIEEAKIKIHDIEYRVKKYPSLEKKIRNSSGSPSKRINDIVGARVICLFISDLSQIDDLIGREFQVVNKDDKISTGTDAFGYMSVHYICKLKKSVAGRRYDSIKSLTFEVQVRTLCMHAWAAISHYLDYQSEWDIPDHLKKGLNALSGLFYVADSQYEQLFKARDASRDSAQSAASSDTRASTPINLDTMVAALSRQFPERILINSQISDLIPELIEAGFSSVEEVLDAVEHGKKDLDKDERNQLDDEENRSLAVYYTAAGAVRISLKDSHEGYRSVYKSKLEKIWRPLGQKAAQQNPERTKGGQRKVAKKPVTK